MTYPSIRYHYPDGYAALYLSYETGSNRNNPFSIGNKAVGADRVRDI